MFLTYFRGLCTDLIRKLPSHNSTTLSKGLPVKPQWTSCAQFGHSLPGPSGYFALWLSSHTERSFHGKLAGSMAHMWPESPAAGRKKHVAGKPFSYSAEQTRSSHIISYLLEWPKIQSGPLSCLSTWMGCYKLA